MKTKELHDKIVTLEKENSELKADKKMTMDAMTLILRHPWTPELAYISKMLKKTGNDMKEKK